MGQFASKLKELREGQGLSVRALSRALDKSAGYISRIEGRGEIPSTEFVTAVADLFETEVETLLELLKIDQMAKAEREIDKKHGDAIQLYRKGRKR